MSDDRKIINLTCQLYDVRVKRDGGGRVALDFGADSLHGVQELLALNAQGDVNLLVVLVPFTGPNPPEYPKEVDPVTGEIKI